MNVDQYIQPELNFLSILILFGIIQGGIIWAYLQVKRPEGYQLLSLFILALIVPEIEALLFTSGYLVKSIHLYFISIPFVLISAPLLLAYIYQISGHYNAKSFWPLHGAPILAITVYSSLFYIQPAEKKMHHYLGSVLPDIDLPTPHQYFNVDPLEINGWIFVEGMALFLLLYGLYGCYRIQKLRSDEHLTGPKSWLWFLASLLVMSSIILFLAEGGVIEGKILYKPILPTYLTRVFTCVSMYAIATYLMLNGQILHKTRKYQNSRISPSLRTAKVRKILNAFENSRIYQRTDHSLSLLSEVTGIQENHLSELINQDLGQSFYELTNRYRIQEAIDYLESTKPLDKTMDELASGLGYKSKSTFYNAFKKEKGQTPLQYWEKAH